MPIGTGHGQQFKDDFEAALYEFQGKDQVTPTPDQMRDPMEIAPESHEQFDFHPDLKANFFQTVSEMRAEPDDDQQFLAERGTFEIKQDLPKTGRSAFDVLTGADGKERFQTWPEKAVRSVAESARKLMTGEVNPSSEEGIKATFDVASSLVMGPAAPMKLGLKLADGTLGSFAGVGSKTINKGNLKVAQVMDDLGKSSDEIWEKTGFFKGTDGRWLYEIPEPKVDKLLPLIKWKEKQTLGDVLDHPELYKAYPEIKNYPVELRDLKGHIAAVNSARISIDPKKIASEDTMMRVLTHEIQHILQKAERRESTGSNPKEAADIAEMALRRRMADSNLKESELKEMFSLLRDITKNKKEFGEYLYKTNPGEIEANLAMRRYETQNFKDNPERLQGYLEEKGLSEKPVRIPDIEIARMSAMAEKPTDFRKAANDNAPLHPSQGKDPFQLPADEIKGIVDRATKEARDTWASGIAESKDFLKDWDAMHAYGQTLTGKNYTELNVARYNKMRKDIAEKYDMEYNPIEYDPNPFDKYPEVKAAKERADKAYEDIKKDIEALKAKYPEEDFTPAFIRRFMEWIRGESKKD